MTNEDTNQSEWSDAKNWPRGIYRSRIDSRMIVPKRRGFGVTINFGNRIAVFLFLAFLALPLVILLAVYFTQRH
jgi:uncharacterized membrane protein